MNRDSLDERFKIPGQPTDADKTASISSDSKTGLDNFQSIEGLNSSTVLEDGSLERRSSKTIPNDVFTEEKEKDMGLGTKVCKFIASTSLSVV